jgi:hypothetical protein
MQSMGDALRGAEGTGETNMVNVNEAYAKAIIDLRNLLAKIGRHEFRAYGYSKQLRAYRARVSAN